MHIVKKLYYITHINKFCDFFVLKQYLTFIVNRIMDVLASAYKNIFLPNKMQKKIVRSLRIQLKKGFYLLKSGPCIPTTPSIKQTPRLIHTQVVTKCCVSCYTKGVCVRLISEHTQQSADESDSSPFCHSLPESACM